MTYIPPKSDGGPAFPAKRTSKHVSGMSLLDYFAGLAMQSLINRSMRITGDLLLEMNEAIAADAYKIADAMIQQREYWIARRHKQEEPE